MTAPFPLRRLFVLLAAASAACDPVDPGHSPPDMRCEVDAPDGVISIRASPAGVVFASATDDPLAVVVERAAGLGCALSIDGAPLAAHTLLDVDDAGNLYVFGAETDRPGVVSTLLPGTSPESMVVVVDTADAAAELVYSGRGIWTFGVAPGGDALWVTACGPTGVFTIDASGLIPAMDAPDTLWQFRPSVLTDGDTFWSVGFRTCGVFDEVTPDCGYDLVRTTAHGSQTLGTTVADLGGGFEEGSLARCGDRVCGVFSHGVVVWDRDGEVVFDAHLADLGALPSEAVVEASGNAAGIYVLLRGDAGNRVVFVPVSAGD